jgi:hypothetical protein
MVPRSQQKADGSGFLVVLVGVMLSGTALDLQVTNYIFHFSVDNVNSRTACKIKKIKNRR